MEPRTKGRLLPTLLAALAAGWMGGTVSAVVPIDGGAPLILPRIIHTGPGDEYDAHSGGDLVSYTAGNEIRFYDFFSGADAQVPSAASFVDTLSDVRDGRIVFNRYTQTTGGLSIVVYDVTVGTTTEIDPQPVPFRTSPSVGNGTVAFIDLASTSGGELFASRLGGATFSITNDTRIDQNPAVAPSGNLIVYESCATSPLDCDIRQATWSGSSWTVAPLTANSEPELSPDTDGYFVVYEAVRAGEPDIYWQWVGGGAERRLELPGQQRNPSVSNGVILFESVAVGESAADLWLYRIDTNCLFRVTSTVADESLSDIDVLPDGTLHIAWTSGPAGARDVIGATVELPPCVATPEACDGFDNDCDGLVDEGILTPSAHPLVVATKLQPSGDLRLSWGATAGTTGYDVVRGSLASLRSSAGNFTFAVDACLGNDLPTLQALDAGSPPSGNAYWYLVRPVNACTEPGTYNDWMPPQIGSRDPGIDASPSACPW